MAKANKYIKEINWKHHDLDENTTKRAVDVGTLVRHIKSQGWLKKKKEHAPVWAGIGKITELRNELQHNIMEEVGDEEFKELYGVFSNRTYDSLDPVDESFIKDYEHFKSRTFELDRKLGAVLGRAA